MAKLDPKSSFFTGKKANAVKQPTSFMAALLGQRRGIYQISGGWKW